MYNLINLGLDTKTPDGRHVLSKEKHDAAIKF